MRLSAPGKVFLTGEYAVLWGAPAVLAAVEPRLVATLEPRDDGKVELRVPGGTSACVRHGDALRWTGPEAPSRFVRAVVEVAKPTRGFTLAIAKAASAPKGQKLGLGSSASAAVLAAAAVLGVDDRDAVFRVAARAHWEAQGQRGSNGDVAAACYGGLLRYVCQDLDAQQRPDVAQLPPRALRLALVYSGRAVKTPSMVVAVEAALAPDARAAFARESSAVTEAFCAAVRDGRRAPALEALNAAGELLGQLGARAGVAIVTPTLRKIIAIARGHGLAAKVSGAGGGDGAVLAGFDARGLRAALTELRGVGLHALELPISGGVSSP
jgi:phosphomevalonate kinase